MDVLYPQTAGITEYTKPTINSRNFIENIESELGLKVVLIGTGADVNAVIDRRNRTTKLFNN